MHEGNIALLNVLPKALCPVLCDIDASKPGEPSAILSVSVKGPGPAAVTKRAERAIGGARAACFEQPEGVYSGCVDARQTRYTTYCYSISIHP